MKKSEKSVFFPILINLQKFPCLVVGGGEVALRKVEVLLKYNSQITILSPKVCKPLDALIKQHNITIIKHKYSREYLKDFKVVISATDVREVNKVVHNDCKKVGILLNVVDTPDLCDFILPATVKRDDLTISISSQGKAPFLAKDIKQRLEHIYSDVYSDITELAGKFRTTILNSNKFDSQKSKTSAFNKFLTIDWKRILRAEGKSKAQKELNKILKKIDK
jgi:precorrin-2 dehydrogenase/sirohydrochlorin ferrochelatase